MKNKNVWIPQAGEDGTSMMQGQRQSQYKTLRDMIDGGGPGASGDKFQGGGMISQIANMLATPAQPLDQPAAPPAAPTAAPVAAPAPRPVVSTGGTAPAPQYSGRGSYGMPQPPQMPNLMDTMAAARTNRAEDAFLNSFGYQDRAQPQSLETTFGEFVDLISQPRAPQYSGRGSVGMPQRTVPPNEAEITAYLRSIGRL